MAGPFILKPTKITDAVLSSSTIAEPATGEVAWVSAGAYALGDERIRVATHRIYRCVLAHSGRSAAPENDPMYWLDIGATARWKCFDEQVSSQSVTASDLTIVLRPGVFNALALYALDGATITVTVKDQPGGTVLYQQQEDLYEPFPDWYEWLFSPYKSLKSLILTDLPGWNDTSELTIQISASGGDRRGVGMIAVGDMASLAPSPSWGTEYGATVEPVDYSYIKTDEFGNTVIKKRPFSTGLEVTAIVATEDLDYAMQIIQDVLGTPVAFIATDAKGFQTTNVFGLLSARGTYESHVISRLHISVKGLI